jgi:DNA-binding MarR family transcriptional regulator
MQTERRLPSPKAAPHPCACTTVRRASRVLARVFDAALEGAGLGVTQFAVLRAIERHQGEALTRVAEDLCMDRTSLYRAVATMYRAGWLLIADGPGARARTATVTKKGHGVLRAADLRWARAQTAIIDRFGRTEWPALVASLQRLSTSAQEMGQTWRQEVHS